MSQSYEYKLLKVTLRITNYTQNYRLLNGTHRITNY